MKRRQISVSVPQSQAGLASMGSMRLQPNYSLNSIRPNPENPRRADMESHGMTLQAVKSQMRQEGEPLADFQSRVERWIEQNSTLDSEAKTEWYKLLGLAVSISEDGLNQPVAVRLVDPADSIATLISGERRFLASWLGNLKSVHAIVRVQSDSEASTHALIENTQRSDLSFRATVTTLISMQAESEEPFTVTQVMRLGSYSRGGAAYVHQALNLPLDHPVHKAIQSGSATKPFHIKKILDELKVAKAPQPQQPKQSTQQSTGQRGGTTSESLDGTQPAASKTGSTGTSADDSIVGHVDLQQGGAEFKGAQDTAPNPDTELERPEPSVQPPAVDANSASSSEISWEMVRDWLAKACLDAHQINGSAYQRLANEIEKIHSADEVLAFIQKAAELSVED